MRTLCISIAVISIAMVLMNHNLRVAAADQRAIPTAVLAHLDDQPPPLHLGHRAASDLPPLTDEELGTSQQQSLLTALTGDPYLYRADDHGCAGCSMLICPHAIWSNTAHYGGYRVGGGVPCRRDQPDVDEGTFGWDYFGVLFPKRIALNWSHGRRYQGGAGAYKTEGPKLK